MGRAWRRVYYWWHRERLARELADEVEAHRVMSQDALRQRGLSSAAAAAASHRALGDVMTAREDARGVWLAPWLDSVGQDIRVGIRSLRKRPGMTTVAVLTLALGIGANSAVFSLLNASLFRVMPGAHPEQLVFLQQLDSTGGSLDFSWPNVEQLRRANRTLAALAAYDGSRFSATVQGVPALIAGEFVAGNYFSLLDGHASTGRPFGPADDEPSAPAVVVISTAYWQRTLAADPHAVGTTILLGQIPFTVVGIMPIDFRGRRVAGTAPDVWVPMAWHARLALRDHISFGLVGRLKEGVALTVAQADLSAAQGRFLHDSAGAAASPASLRDLRGRSLVMRSGLHGENGTLKQDAARQTMLVAAIVALVLLIACVNVASLLVARAADRQKEIAVRLAIGAGRARLVRQLLTEALLLAGAGALVGLACSAWGARALVSVIPLSPSSSHPATSILCLAFTASLALGTGLLFGILPALTGTRLDLAPVLRGTDASGAGGRTRHRLSRVLVVSQVALALALVVGASLLSRSLQQLQRSDPGFAADKVLTAYIYPVLLGLDHDREVALYRALVAGVARVPGVQSASLVRYSLASADNFVGPGFFSTMGIRMVHGRDFSDAVDRPSGPRVVVVSEAEARLQFNDDDVVGRTLLRGDHAGAVVVGVVRDIRHTAWQEHGDASTYQPIQQADPTDLGQVHLLARTSGNPRAILPAFQRAVHAIEPDLPIVSSQTVADDLGQSVATEASVTTLLGGFGVLAAGLALIGIYGTMSHAVARRTRELGIRMSLGADGNRVVRSVLGESIGLVVAGTVASVPLVFVTSRLLRTMLFHTAPADPVAIASAVALMLLVAVVAGAVPAWRASRITPMAALRQG